jgi:hypothetical protein
VSSEQFYVDYYLNGLWPECKCGCKNKVKWSWQLKGFRDYCQGHQSRVKNNWGHNPKALEHSLDTRKERFSTGEITTWNNGLTKETNESVKRYGEKISERFTLEIRDEYSKRMRKLRNDGKIVPLYGNRHSQWNGGTSSISMLVYNDVSFYKKWKYPILVKDGFKCVECGSNKKLHIHHDKEMLCEIIKKYVGDEIDVSNFNTKRKIANEVINYHINNKVSGITLCSKCHESKHPSLNF